MLDWDILFKYSVHEWKALFAVGLGDKNNHDLVHIFFYLRSCFSCICLLFYWILKYYYFSTNKGTRMPWMLGCLTTIIITAQ